MAWPYDAVRTTYGPLQPLDYVDLDDWQNRIVDCHRERKITLLGALPTWDGAAPGWYWNPIGYWVCTNVVVSLVIPIPCQAGYRLKDVEVKSYNGDVLAGTYSLYGWSSNFDTPLLPPSYEGSPTPIVSASPTGSVGTWVVVSLTPPSTETATDDRSFCVDCLLQQTADFIGGVRATFEPITPTP